MLPAMSCRLPITVMVDWAFKMLSGGGSMTHDCQHKCDILDVSACVTVTFKAHGRNGSNKRGKNPTAKVKLMFVHSSENYIVYCALTFTHMLKCVFPCFVWLESVCSLTLCVFCVISCQCEPESETEQGPECSYSQYSRDLINESILKGFN